MSSVLVNLAVRGLSAGAKVILKQLKTLLKKPKKTATDRKKIAKLKKELNADKTVKAKKDKLQSQKYKAGGRDMANKPTKQDKAMLKEGERYLPSDPNKKGKLDLDREYYEGLPREMKKAGNIAKTPKQIKKQVRKVVAEEFKKKKGFSTGGLPSKKNYANPVKFVNNLKK
jgi:hypothetical protein